MDRHRRWCESDKQEDREVDVRMDECKEEVDDPLGQMLRIYRSEGKANIAKVVATITKYEVEIYKEKGTLAVEMSAEDIEECEKIDCLTPLTKEELKTVPELTEEEIKEALKQGRLDKEAAREWARGSMRDPNPGQRYV